jgi:glycosyltransferase involved in cell wall biosynthesis
MNRWARDIMPRSLLLYTHGLVGGGAERVIALLAAGLSERDHDVVLALDFEGRENAHLVPPSVRQVLLGRGHVAAVRKLAELIDETRPDAALAGVGASNPKLLAARRLARHRPATILTVHGRIDVERRPFGYLGYAATPLTSRLADRTVAVSNDLRRYLVERFGADRRRTVAIANPVMLPAAAQVPTRDALVARPEVVLSVGRLVPEKGHDTLIRAVAQSKRRPRLVVLGEGPDRARLSGLASSLGVADRVELRGYVPDPSPVYGEARLLALASTSEAFGNVLVEALGHGLPVVATRCGGPAEILADGRHGRLVPIGDPAALAIAIDAGLADPGDPARHRARADDFAVPAALDRYERLIEDVLAEKTAPSAA